MVTLVVFLLVLIGGLISLATLPIVVSLPLMVVIGAFAVLVIAELWRSYQDLDSARALDSVRVPSVIHHAAAPSTGRELIGE
jgi:choline-glycine betaine transporter